MQAGNTVRAKTKITEELYPDVWVMHAKPGELGTVLATNPGRLPTIKFHESGTTYDCAPEEIELVGDADQTPRFAYVTCEACEGQGRVIETTTLGAVSFSAPITCKACEGFQQALVRI